MNTEYKELSDEELIDRIREGDRNAADFLLEKYKPLVLNKSNKMFILGGDRDDLIQEGMIGLLKAVNDFDFGRDASFATFANLCVSRQLFTAVKKADTQKSIPLNSYISIYEEDFQEEGGINPEEVFLDRERVADLDRAFKKELSGFEKEVLDLKLAGMDYQEIALILGKTPKSIDNALNRIKSKIKKIIT